MSIRCAIAMAAVLAAGMLPLPAVADDDPTVAQIKAGPLSPTLKELAGQLPDSGTELPLLTRPNGRLMVDVRVADTSADTIARLRDAGAVIRFVAPDVRTITVAMDADKLKGLADLAPLVEYAQEIPRPISNATCPSGTFTTEGLTQLKTSLASSLYAVTGRDVTVGVLSDSYDLLDGAGTDVGNAELPGAGNPCGHTTTVVNQQEGPAGGDDEGRAMAQIIHDIAPDAKILFASASNGQASFAQSIRDLAAAGADIIVDDFTYPSEPMYQDGLIGKAVSDVTDAGVAYFSSAANSNAEINGVRVGSFESPFYRPNACPDGIEKAYKGVTVDCHDFDPSAVTDTTYGLSVNYISYLLSWNQPTYGVTTDFDLCIENDFDVVLGCRQSDNVSSGAPYEGFERWFPGPDPFPVNLVIVRVAGNGMPRLRLVSSRTELSSVEHPTGTLGDVVGPTTFGHNASRPGVTVAAVPFNNSAALEQYSSWGPATYCWGPVVGTKPAAQLQPCEKATVDLAATDGNRNSFFGGTDMFGVHRFYGTSAAAPHAAAVAALLLDKEQCLTQSELVSYLKTGARTVGTATVDGAGAGLIDAVPALAAAGAKNCDVTAPQVTITAPHGTPGGWYPSPVKVKVTAVDRRTVTSISCTAATMSGFVAAGKTSTAFATSVGEGQRTLTCTAKDAENNSGAALGSSNVLTVKIDTVKPTLTCRPASFTQYTPGTVIADVTDGGSGPAAATASQTVSTATAGSFTTTVTGKDTAGNTGTASCGYTVVAAPDTTGPILTCRPATFGQGDPGTVTADVTDSASGPVADTVSAIVSTATAGSFTVSLTAADQASNTTTVSCPYTVTAAPGVDPGTGPTNPGTGPTDPGTGPTDPGTGPDDPGVTAAVALTGPKKVRKRTRATYTASGLPVGASVTWTVAKKAKTIRTKRRRATASGGSVMKVRFAKKGRYVVSVASGAGTASMRVRVK